MKTAVAVACLLAVTYLAEGKTLDLQRGVIVHLFEWSYPEIAKECEEFLSPKGFAGVQISPPTENLVVEGQWWERYQVVSYQLISRSGNEDQLRDMLTRCNRVGVRVFADVVFNHMTGNRDNCRGVGNSTCNTRDLSYPAVPYTREDFHQPQCSINNYKSPGEVRNCELVGLHDLDQSRESVREKIVKLLNHLIDIGVAGFRIDAAKHMNPNDLSVIYQRLKYLNTEQGFPAKTKPLIYQEVIDKGGEGVKYEEYTPLGLVTDFRLGDELGRCFQGKNDLKWLRNFGTEWNLLPEQQSIVFIDNHDTERTTDDKNTLNYKKSRAYKMAVVFMLAKGDYTSKILSGYQFSSFDQGPPSQPPRPINKNVCSHGWVCQHRWRQIYNAVGFHNVVKGTPVTTWWDNGKNQIAFCRGNKGFVAFNLEDYDLKRTLQTCLPEGEYCDIISGEVTTTGCSGKTVHVSKDGRADIFISRFNPESAEDGVLAIHVKSVTPSTQ
ncbi:alpha-amylase 4N-like [Macrosteles quadrilineatus]|uniref:alpha-amylase 4N-like n=1 Tax=Macrosteles quadrilineatus TaxID=74068 RepID=UPI0023E2AABF|nr:alpha-amylase 4N-like [Macrosteles quadrilineatus]